jgi:hypothetical protein
MNKKLCIVSIGLLALIAACASPAPETDASILPVVLGDGQVEILAGTYVVDAGVIRLTDDALSGLQNDGVSLMWEADGRLASVTSARISVGELAIGDGLSLVDDDRNVVGYLAIASLSWVEETDEGDVRSFFPILDPGACL